MTSTGEERTALAVVCMLTERATQRLSGASVVREDVRQAVIRAVLAAVNRRVEPMLVDAALLVREEPVEEQVEQAGEERVEGTGEAEADE